MQHTIQTNRWANIPAPQFESMLEAIDACVHCGFCLPTCPTYKVMNEEMNSPRGRIVLMKSVLEEKVGITDVEDYIDKCLGCLGCVTSCPSGVQYQDLLHPFRSYLEENRERKLFEGIRNSLVDQNIHNPERFRVLTQLGKSAKPLAGMMPSNIRSMLEVLPDHVPEKESYPEVIPATGNRRGRIALLTGCVQQVLAPEINRATINVLTSNGIEVVIPAGQVCCGGVAQHSGLPDQALELARENLEAFPRDVDAIISNAAGCGSAMKEYPAIFAKMDEYNSAVEFRNLVMDISEYLDQIELTTRMAFDSDVNIVYHDACHLAHAQNIIDPPRKLLKQIDRVNIIEIDDGKLCCGSAGTYNYNQPETAYLLGEMKTRQILETRGDMVTTGNIGCLIQLRNHLKESESKLPVLHTIQVLDLSMSNGTTK